MNNKTDKSKETRSNSWPARAGWIVATLAVSALALTYFFYAPRQLGGATYFNNRYPFLNPAASLIDKDNLLVNFQDLRNSLTDKYERRDDYLVSVYFEYLPTGANISINKDAKIWPASLIKIPVALAAMKKVERGEWKMTNELVILDEDKDSEFGTLYQRLSGTRLTIQDLFRESLVNSDNTAHFVFLRNLDGSELEDVYTHLGLDDILNSLKTAPKDEEPDNRMTAKNYSVFFRSLYNATFLSSDYSQLFLDILKDAPSEYARSGVPADVVFAHKTGIRIDKKVWADAGIVYVPERPYLLVVMIQKKDGVMPERSEVDQLFRGISGEIYNYVSEAH